MNAPRNSTFDDDIRVLGEVLERIRLSTQQNREGLLKQLTANIKLAAEDHADLVGNAKQIYQQRRHRDKTFNGLGLFSDPAWDILLDLFIAHHESSEISVSSSCIAAAVASTTALRWIETLVRDGLVKREADIFDRRRRLLTITPKGLQLMSIALQPRRRS